MSGSCLTFELFLWHSEVLFLFQRHKPLHIMSDATTPLKSPLFLCIVCASKVKSINVILSDLIMNGGNYEIWPCAIDRLFFGSSCCALFHDGNFVWSLLHFTLLSTLETHIESVQKVLQNLCLSACVIIISISSKLKQSRYTIQCQKINWSIF